jgi:hypothetical protein
MRLKTILILLLTIHIGFSIHAQSIGCYSTELFTCPSSNITVSDDNVTVIFNVDRSYFNNGNEYLYADYTWDFGDGSTPLTKRVNYSEAYATETYSYSLPNAIAACGKLNATVAVKVRVYAIKDFTLDPETPVKEEVGCYTYQKTITADIKLTGGGSVKLATEDNLTTYAVNSNVKLNYTVSTADCASPNNVYYTLYINDTLRSEGNINTFNKAKYFYTFTPKYSGEHTLKLFVKRNGEEIGRDDLSLSIGNNQEGSINNFGKCECGNDEAKIETTWIRSGNKASFTIKDVSSYAFKNRLKDCFVNRASSDSIPGLAYFVCKIPSENYVYYFNCPSGSCTVQLYKEFDSIWTKDIALPEINSQPRVVIFELGVKCYKFSNTFPNISIARTNTTLTPNSFSDSLNNISVDPGGGYININLYTEQCFSYSIQNMENQTDDLNWLDDYGNNEYRFISLKATPNYTSNTRKASIKVFVEGDYSCCNDSGKSYRTITVTQASKFTTQLSGPGSSQVAVPFGTPEGTAMVNLFFESPFKGDDNFYYSTPSNLTFSDIEYYLRGRYGDYIGRSSSEIYREGFFDVYCYDSQGKVIGDKKTLTYYIFLCSDKTYTLADVYNKLAHKSIVIAEKDEAIELSNKILPVKQSLCLFSSNYVMLNPGFEVPAGAYFAAAGKDCGNQTTQPQTVSANSQKIKESKDLTLTDEAVIEAIDTTSQSDTKTVKQVEQEQSYEVEINKIKQEQVVIFPNPASEEVKVLSTDATIMQSIEIRNFQGNIVWQKSVTNNTQSVNMAQFLNGVYLFKIFTNEGVIMRKVVLAK